MRSIDDVREICLIKATSIKDIAPKIASLYGFGYQLSIDTKGLSKNYRSRYYLYIIPSQASSMDLVTQGVLGASIAQLGFQKSLGRKALFWGALMGILPDIDIVLTLMPFPEAEIRWHRAFTHSLLFAPLFAPLLGAALWRFYQKRGEILRLASWIGLVFWALFTHPLLDLFTHYGTQLLSPFSDHRFSLAAVSIIDLFYTVPLVLALFIGVFYRPRPEEGKKFLLIPTSAACALLLTTCYLFYGMVQNSKAEDIARAQLIQEGITFNTLKAYPTLLQVFVRRIVVHTSTEIRVGFISTRTPRPIRWYRQVKYSGPLLKDFNQQYCVKKFKWFCDNDYVITLSADTANTYIARIYDLRYGYWGLGNASILGLWGRMTRLDKSGRLISNCQRFYTLERLQDSLSMSTVP